MFEVLDDPDEIEKRFQAGPVLCYLINPNIEFSRLHYLVHNYYLLELGSAEQSIKAMACGFSKKPFSDTLTPEQAKQWNGTDQETLESPVLDELMDIDDNPYLILNKSLSTQQVDYQRLLYKVSYIEYKSDMRYCIACVYYTRSKRNG